MSETGGLNVTNLRSKRTDNDPVFSSEYVASKQDIEKDTHVAALVADRGAVDVAYTTCGWLSQWRTKVQW